MLVPRLLLPFLEFFVIDVMIQKVQLLERAVPQAEIEGRVLQQYDYIVEFCLLLVDDLLNLGRIQLIGRKDIPKVRKGQVSNFRDEIGVLLYYPREDLGRPRVVRKMQIIQCLVVKSDLLDDIYIYVVGLEVCFREVLLDVSFQICDQLRKLHKLPDGVVGR